MSHFVVGVIVPLGTTKENLEWVVEELLAPYDENMEIDEYETDCGCAEWKAHQKATSKAVEGLGSSMEELREGYDALPEDVRPEWKDWIKPLTALQENWEQKFLKTEKPKADCFDCGGTGKYMTTYNPDSKWDWWRVGGRWDGLISKEGKYRESDDKGFNFHPCHERIENNSCLVKEFPLNETTCPFALLLPDVGWIERGSMGWWGVVSDAKDAHDWILQVEEILFKYQDHTIVGVDCHI